MFYQNIQHRKSVFYCFSPHYFFTIKQMKKPTPCNTYILLDVLLCSIAEYFYELCRIFGEPVGRVKIQTSKNSQRYYTTKRLIRDLLSNTPNYYVRGGEPPRILIYGGMRDRSMRSGTKLARGIQPTDWSTAGNLSNRSSGVQIPRDICTRFGRYLYSTKCSWIINCDKTLRKFENTRET